MLRIPLATLAAAFAGSLLGQPPSTSDSKPADALPAASPAARQPSRETVQIMRFSAPFRPFKTDIATLSPDGRLLAYSVREGEDLCVAIVEVDNPTVLKSKVIVLNNQSATAMVDTHSGEKTPAHIRWMRWVTPTRLAVETNRVFPEVIGQNWTSNTGEILSFEADGSDAKSLVTPRDVKDSDTPFAGERNPAGGSRNRNALLEGDRIASPDKPLQDETILTTGPDNPRLLEKEILTAQFSDETLSGRSPRIFDLDPENHESVQLHAGTLQKYDRYRLNVVSGKLGGPSSDGYIHERAALLDRQGRARASVPNNFLTRFPHAYSVDRGGLLRWAELDKVTASLGQLNFSVSPETFFHARSFPVGFDENPEILYYASNIGRDTFGIYGLNIKTGQRTPIAVENPMFDLADPAPDGFPSNPLMFDRFSRKLIGVRYEARLRTAVWFHPDWQKLQSSLEKTLPGQIVEILEWDREAKRFLLLARAPSEPGAFYIYEPATGRLSEFIRRNPAHVVLGRSTTYDFAFEHPTSGPLTGLITLPRNVRAKPIPIVVALPNEPWMRNRGEYRAEISALSSMGFAILQVNPRGSLGLGLRHRTASDSARFDEVQVQDIVAVIDELSQKFPLNPKRVALFGEKRGGYLALRALQLRPDRFRCAATIEPTVSIKDWLAENRWGEGLTSAAMTQRFYGADIAAQSSPLTAGIPKVTRPALFLSYPGLPGETRPFSYLGAKNLARTLESQGTAAPFFDLTPDYVRRLPEARGEAFAHIEDFLNEHIYAYNVKLGETEVKEDDVKPAPLKK